MKQINLEKILEKHLIEQFGERFDMETIMPEILIPVLYAMREAVNKAVEMEREWISVDERLPKHLEQCLFKLDNGNICIGKCRYFEYGDSELIEMYGKSLSYLSHTYRNWELHNFDRTEKPIITHWKEIH